MLSSDAANVLKVGSNVTEHGTGRADEPPVMDMNSIDKMPT